MAFLSSNLPDELNENVVILKCLGHPPPYLPQHQGQNHAGSGGLLHPGPQTTVVWVYLFPKMLHNIGDT